MTDIEQLERDLKDLANIINFYDEGDSPYDTSVLIRIEKTARAHIEAMKQEPIGYLVRNPMIARKPVKALARYPETTEWLYPSSRKNDAKSFSLTVRGELVPLYTASLPAEQPVLKVPEVEEIPDYLEDYSAGVREGRNQLIKEIIAMNAHLKVEEME